MKMEGTNTNSEWTEMEKIEHPKPNREFVY